MQIYQEIVAEKHVKRNEVALFDPSNNKFAYSSCKTPKGLGQSIDKHSRLGYRVNKVTILMTRKNNCHFHVEFVRS